MAHNPTVTKYLIRIYIVLSLLIITPAGFILKSYSGIGRWWFNNHGAGVLYELFWILVVFFIVPRKQYVSKIPVGVFIITCALEILQLWHPWFLEKIRSYYFGRALIGTTFTWWDFPHYAIGCIMGWILIKWLYQKSTAHY